MLLLMLLLMLLGTSLLVVDVVADAAGYLPPPRRSEIERLELMIAEAKNSIEKYKGQGVSTDTQRKKVLRGLEEQLAATEVCGPAYGRHAAYGTCDGSVLFRGYIGPTLSLIHI